MILFGEKNKDDKEKEKEDGFLGETELLVKKGSESGEEQEEERIDKDNKADTALLAVKDKEENKGENFWARVKLKIVMLQTVSLRDKIFFVQNLRVMIRGGLSLAAALETIASQVTNSMFKKVLMEISGRVQGGVTFSKSLERYPKIFSPLFINMIKSGEVSGNLEDVLEKLHTQMKKDHELVSKVKGAMIYPSVVMVAMFGIGGAMMIFVVPKLITIFEEFRAKLPLPTRVLIAVSKFIVSNGPWVALFLAVFVIFFVKFYRSETGKVFFHRLFLRLPIISGIVKKINLARFCRTLSSLLKTDIAIVQSLEITSMVVGNIYYRQALLSASQKIVKGMQINKVLADYPKLFPPTVIQMIKVGEDSGAIDSVMDEVAKFYEEDIEQVMQNLPSIIEPILILVLGLGVGAMAVAIIMPMYSLTSAI